MDRQAGPEREEDGEQEADDEEAAGSVVGATATRRGRRSRAAGRRGRRRARRRSAGKAATKCFVHQPPRFAIVGTTRFARSALKRNASTRWAASRSGEDEVEERRGRRPRPARRRPRAAGPWRGAACARRGSAAPRGGATTTRARVSVNRISVESSICPARTAPIPSASRRRERSPWTNRTTRCAATGSRNTAARVDVRQPGREHVGGEAEDVAAGERGPDRASSAAGRAGTPSRRRAPASGSPRRCRRGSGRRRG